MLLGHARGKVGDLVFSRSNGQQVIRSRASEVKNPRTAAQMIQRILLNTIAQAYSRMQEIADHSYQGVPTGAKTMAAFISENLNMLREELSNAPTLDVAYAVTQLGSQLVPLNPYIISKGTLSSPIYSATSQPTIIDFGPKLLERDWDITTVPDEEGALQMSAATFCDLFGVEIGDQLTFVHMDQPISGVNRFRFARVIVQPQNAQGEDLPDTAAFLTRSVGGDVTFANQNTKNENVAYLTQKGISGDYNNSLQVEFPEAGATAIIRSRKVNGVWERSTERFLIGGFTGDNAANRGDSLADALDALEDIDFDLINPFYLNNASK